MTPLCPIQSAPITVPDAFIISPEAVQRKLAMIKVHKAIGPDLIPNWVLRDLAPTLTAPLSSIFNSSIAESYIPRIWRSADVIPVPKKSPMVNLSKDLRPISLTPVISKAFESIVVSWMQGQVNHCESQYGAMKGCSTTMALINLIHNLMIGLDQPGTYARILLIDYSKAFDRIDHNILLDKLSTNGVHPVLVSWQRSFLTECQQCVKIGQTKSEWQLIKAGVPQGTYSGPEDFINMLDDMQTCLPDLKYVDETSIYENVGAGEMS